MLRVDRLPRLGGGLGIKASMGSTPTCTSTGPMGQDPHPPAGFFHSGFDIGHSLRVCLLGDIIDGGVGGGEVPHTSAYIPLALGFKLKN